MELVKIGKKAWQIAVICQIHQLFYWQCFLLYGIASYHYNYIQLYTYICIAKCIYTFPRLKNSSTLRMQSIQLTVQNIPVRIPMVMK